MSMLSIRSREADGAVTKWEGCVPTAKLTASLPILVCMVKGGMGLFSTGDPEYGRATGQDA
eukprot:1808576-Amphidinium_carterae.1